MSGCHDLLPRPRSLLLFLSLIAPHVACTGNPGGPDAGSPSSMDSSIVEVEGRSPDLVCPGARGCEASDGDLLVGVAARDVTPAVEEWDDLDANGRWDPGEPFEDLNGNGEWDGVWIAGFSMGRAATDVHDPLWARALVLEKGDLRVGLVALDFVGWFNADAVKVRVAAAAAGLDLDHVVVASTHSHEGPDTMGMWGEDPSVTGYDPAYVDYVVARAVDALGEATVGQRRASVRAAQAPAPDLIHDSRLPEVIDPTITGVQFLGDDGEPFAHLVVWGNHPESLGGDNTRLSSDYPHYLRKYLEDAWEGSTAVFFAGTLGGLMNPLHIVGCPDNGGNDTCPVGDFDRAQYIGEGVASLIERALEQSDSITAPPDAELRFRRHSYLADISNQTLVLAFKLGLLSRDAYLKEDGTRFAADRLREVEIEDMIGLMGLGTEVGALRIGPVEVVTVPGELYPELWLVKEDGSAWIEHPEGADHPDAPSETPLQASMPDAPMRAVINNANDSIGYIIPKPQWDNTGPRAYEADGQYGEQNSLGADTAPQVTQAVIELYALEP